MVIASLQVEFLEAPLELSGVELILVVAKEHVSIQEL